MPTSHPQQINEVMELIISTNPQSMLDVGIGFGKYGFLSREYLELWDGRESYNDWKRQIDGVEIFEEYITPIQKQIYSQIFVGNALDIVPDLKTKYDLILLMDVIEHFTKEDGEKLLRDCMKVGRNVIISTPKDIGSQGDAFDNHYESHISQWRDEDFAPYGRGFSIYNHDSHLYYMGESAAELEKSVRHNRKVRLKRQYPLLAVPGYFKSKALKVVRGGRH